MRVRCGRCQTPFDVSGPGRYECPACGAANQVGDPAASAGLGAMPPDTAGEAPASHDRTTCPDCGFGFVVGDIDVAVCPNCSASVTVGSHHE